MDIRNYTELYIKKDENEHRYIVPQKAGLGEILDVLEQYRAFVIQRIQESAKPKEEKAVEDGGSERCSA